MRFRCWLPSEAITQTSWSSLMYATELPSGDNVSARLPEGARTSGSSWWLPLEARLMPPHQLKVTAPGGARSMLLGDWEGDDDGDGGG